MWKAVHVYYYQSDKEKLLLECIRPAMNELRERFGVERQYIRRHWKLGPHVGLFLDVEEEQFEREIYPFLEERVASYLDANPSTEALKPNYIDLSERLGGWELEPGPYEPLMPDNSISVQPYVRKVDVLQDVKLVEVIEDFFCETVEPFLESIQWSHGDPQKRNEVIVKLLVATAEIFPNEGVTRGHLSYRSHFEGYLKSFDTSGAMQKKFAEIDGQMAEHVDKWVAEVCAHRDEYGVYQGEEAYLRQWSAAQFRLFKAAYDLSVSGVISAPTDNNDQYKEIAKNIGERAVERWSFGREDIEYGEFHKQLYFPEGGRNTFLESPLFSAYRILVNNFYYLLPMLGVNPNSKQLYLYLVCNSVERVKGVTWKELFEQPLQEEVKL